ncbi:hypothetical protein OH786_09270 [Streptomyces atratus]|uniref:Uncharacterized protein n=1 Tax=Streptomyces atratus TaxID=1893 RepID=A0A1K1U6K6_STRAR|nr:hypothetical protein [Streptomyces atratus]SFX08434.1 hypothetical protein SAMN02787144_1001418 [Streptomyces atratus]
MSDQRPGGVPEAMRRRRRWPWVLLVVVLAPAGGGAVAIGVVAGALSREETKPLRVTYASGAFATATCGRF